MYVVMYVCVHVGVVVHMYGCCGQMRVILVNPEIFSTPEDGGQALGV